jgi:hypothetical protein
MIRPLLLRFGMVEVGVLSGIGSIGLTVVLLWRIWRIEITLNARVDELDHSLAIIVQKLVERMDSLKELVPSVNLINQNPIHSLFEWLNSRSPNFQDGVHDFDKHTPPSQDSPIIEIDANATEEKEGQPTTER